MNSGARVAFLILKGIISEMPEADRAVIADCADQLKSIVAAHGDVGLLALALVTAELKELS